MKGKAGAAGGKAKAHRPAAAGAAAAQAAAVPPGNEVASQAAGAQVEEMGAQQPGSFDRKAFIAAVQKAIDAAAPKNLEEADDFKGSGKAAQVKGEVGSLVKGGKKDAEKDIKTATDAPPDASKAKPKVVTPLAPEQPGEAISSVGAANAMPGPRPPEETDLSAGPAQVDEEMEREGVTDEQLANSNEPDFTAALDARQTAKEHSATAPAEYRAQEQEVLAKGRDEAADVESAGLTGMHGAKVAALAKVVSQQGEAKSQDEAKRAKVAADIQAIYDRTKTDVTGILTGLDGKVDSAFTGGEEAARKQFEDYVGAKMDAYKDDRYSGWLGGARWLKDKLFGMPDEVNVFYSQGRSAYLTAMDAVIGQVADIVGGELNAARMRIAQGRTEVRNYVVQLPRDLQKVGKDAEGKLEEQFDQLSSDVDAKQDALVDTLAQKYVASRDALDSRIEELKAANKGLVDKALDAVVGVVKTILKLKDMLLNVLAKAADVIGDIISDPIGFLSNLIGGIKDGLGRFVDNIGTHLKEGLMGWLFGALGDAGIKMPKSFDLAGIFELVMDVLGLTYRNIRARVAKIVGEPVVSKMEETVEVFKMLVTDGPAALWNWIKDKVGDFQEMVFGGLKDFIIERVIKGGVTWLLSLLNPAAAFIKACKAIYDIVMFIVERGSQIMEFVNSVLDSIGAIARGQLSVAAEKVEGALAKALPLAIGFLASLLGLGGITDKIRESIDKVRKPIEKVVDTVVMGAVKGFKKMFGGAIGWVKGKYEKGKAFVKEKATAAKEWATGKAKAAVGWVGEKLGLVKVEKPFTMAGASHTLTAEGDDDSPLEVSIASRFAGRLMPALQRAQDAMQDSPSPNKAQILVRLGQAADRCRALQATWQVRRAAAARDRDQKALERELNEDMVQVIEPLQGLGVDDLDALFGAPRPQRHMPVGWEGSFTRNRLYTGPRSGWGAAEQAVRREEAIDIYSAIDGAYMAYGRRNPQTRDVIEELISVGKLDRETAIPVYEAGQLTSHWVEAQVLSPRAYHVDHIHSLAEHWKDTGHDSTDAERWSVATDPGNLRLITQRANLQKGARGEGEDADYHRYGHQKFVGPNFRSWLADGGIPNALNLDNMPFVDEKGDPLPS
ncbi:MAG TPA: hypothetical protein VFY91_14800 [Microbacterium sp.]|nr:hypothetical protein [Microbacterium sp.]